MRVIRIRIHAQLETKHLTSECGFRKHAEDGLLDHALRMLGEHGGERRESLVSHVAGVMEIALLLGLATRDANLGRVDDDDVVTRVHVRRERWLVLAAYDACDFGGQSSEHHAFGVDDEPVVLDVARCSGVS
jgi:hypothetical protein